MILRSPLHPHRPLAAPDDCSRSAARRRPSREGGRPWRLLLLVCLLGSSIWLASPSAARSGAGEYQLKAAFLYNFLKFVDRPAEAVTSPTTICIGILGRDPFEDALDSLKGKLAKGRRVVVLRVRSVEEARSCDLLFVSASEKGRLSHLLKQANTLHLLTVADQQGFCEAGGMINLVTVNNRIAFDVNLAAANRARLKISSQLLRLAHSVLE
ncbi:YfiR family protein [Geomonas sp. Red32]|uniref:YfiR family protein n=1 Tax=Geomonas sp. Red32 TaxID=2912856 RepID=UPI00202CB1BA|nr:YfiR family protein [Geomonas sp. Red32]MCM0081942.1 YfiR family protein [Geomonas sp. Red32]